VDRSADALAEVNVVIRVGLAVHKRHVMEAIREAIQRAKADGLVTPSGQGPPERTAKSHGPAVLAPRTQAPLPPLHAFQLDESQLLSHRIIAHDDAQSSPFDMLRTQVLHAMDMKEWTFLGVTSPTPGCGKTVTAVNLALSIARQPERSVLLIDLDLRKPSVANYLGLKTDEDVITVLENGSALVDAIVQVEIDKHRLLVLPTRFPSSRSSDRMASHAMSKMLQQIRKDYASHVVIIDLPPVLPSDDVLAVLPLLDCAVVTAAVGVSTATDITETSKHLHSAEVIKVVLNKVPQSKSKYYY
jgi:protein-tyrosine kinase